MNGNLTTIILALGPGAMLGLLGLGLVCIYRSTNVLNLAHAATATLGAYLYYELTVSSGLTPVWAFLIVCPTIGLVSVVIYVLVFRRLVNTSPLTKLVASIGVLVVIQSVLQMRYGAQFYNAPGMLPHEPIRVLGVTVGADRLLLLLIATLVTAALWAAYRYTRFGLATAASAENSFMGSVFGLRMQRVAIGNWFVAGTLAGGAGALLAPITGLSSAQLMSLIVPVLAIALLGSLRSYPLTLVGGLVVAIAQALTTAHTSVQGAADIVPLVIIVIIVIIVGKNLPMRNEPGIRLPRVGSGRIRVSTVTVILVATFVSLYTWIPDSLYSPILVNVTMAIVLLSALVISGYGGQLSLAQLAVAGLGAYFSSRLAGGSQWGFLPTLIVATVLCALFAVLVGSLSLRVRGVPLAVLTMAISVALYSTLFIKDQTVPVGNPTLFGWDVSMLLHPQRYLALALILLVGLMVLVANVRRSSGGRQILAVRGDERAAASLGINVSAVKVSAYGISGAVAGIAGVLIAFQSPVNTLAGFDPLSSAFVLGWATLGGIGYLAGPLVGSFFVQGSLGTELGNAIYNNSSVVALVGGILIILTLLNHPDGVASLGDQVKRAFVHRRVKRAARAGARAAVPTGAEGLAVTATAFRRRDGDIPTLKISDVAVSFGGVRALRGVSMEVAPGEVHGLIGSNGAGKTTLLDVISGFVRPNEGSIHLGSREITGVAPWRRARMGLGRSFQGVQLFPALSVHENVRVAADPRSLRRHLAGVARPSAARLDESAVNVVHALELEPALTAEVDALPHATRQLVSIARALSANPSVVLLDEPAAGLDEVQRAELSTLLRRLARERGIGVVVVEHDVNLVMGVCDRVTVLHEGAVLAAGEPEMVRALPEVIEAYIGSTQLRQSERGDLKAGER